MDEGLTQFACWLPRESRASVPATNTRELMRKTLLALILVVTFAGGVGSQANARLQEVDHWVWPPPADVGPQYFPTASFDQPTPVTGEFRRRWYAQYLRAMKEPSLLDISKGLTAHTYRFVRVSPFAREISVRLTIDSQGTGQLVVKVTTDKGAIIRDETSTIATSDISTFLTLLDRAEFWSKRTNQREDPDLVVHDADHWILEGVKQGAYHVVDRSNLRRGAFEELCVFLARNLGKLENSLFSPMTSP